jgi:hypothetical protein
MCGFSFTVFLSAFQLLPTAPYRILELGGSEVAAGMFLGLLTYASALSAPITGSLADRLGKRRMLVVCSEVRPDRLKAGSPIRVSAVDLYSALRSRAEQWALPAAVRFLPLFVARPHENQGDVDREAHQDDRVVEQGARAEDGEITGYGARILR